MTSRSKKHDHELQVISHTEDWLKVLVNCKDLSCHLTEVIRAPKGKRADVQPHLRKVHQMRHLCCG